MVKEDKKRPATVSVNKKNKKTAKQPKETTKDKPPASTDQSNILKPKDRVQSNSLGTRKSAGLNLSEKSITRDIKFVRNETIHRIVSEKVKMKISQQGLTYLAAAVEYFASEILNETLTKTSTPNRIGTLDLKRSLAEDPDLRFFAKAGVFLDVQPHPNRPNRFVLTGYQG